MPVDMNDVVEQWTYLPMEVRQAIVTMLTFCFAWTSKKVTGFTVRRLCPGVFSAIKSTFTYPARLFTSAPPCPLTQTLLAGLAMQDATIAFMPPRGDKNKVGPAGKVLLLDTFIVQFSEVQNGNKDAVYIDEQNVIGRLAPKHKTLVMDRAAYRHDSISEKADQVALNALIHKAKGAEPRAGCSYSQINVDLAGLKGLPDKGI